MSRDNIVIEPTYTSTSLADLGGRLLIQIAPLLRSNPGSATVQLCKRFLDGVSSRTVLQCNCIFSSHKYDKQTVFYIVVIENNVSLIDLTILTIWMI